MENEMDPRDYIGQDELDPRDPEPLGDCYGCSGDAVVTCDECGAACCKWHHENVEGALYCDACFDRLPDPGDLPPAAYDPHDFEDRV